MKLQTFEDMKEKYIKPDMEIVEMEPMTMLALSSEGGLNVKDEEIDYENGGSELSNRRRNYWDEVGRRG